MGENKLQELADELEALRVSVEFDDDGRCPGNMIEAHERADEILLGALELLMPLSVEVKQMRQSFDNMNRWYA